MGVARKHKYSILAASTATGTLVVARKHKYAIVVATTYARTLGIAREPKSSNMAASTFTGALGNAREPKSTNVAANKGTTSDASMHTSCCTSSDNSSIRVVSLNTEFFVFVASVFDIPGCGVQLTGRHTNFDKPRRCFLLRLYVAVGR